jgi:ribokinase
MTSNVMIVGSLHHDVIVHADRLPQLDETLLGRDVDYAFGGKGGNQAVAAARHGAATAMSGRIGTDGAGQMLLAVLQENHVDCAQIVMDDHVASGMSVAIITASGEYGAVIVSAANLKIDAPAIDVAEGTRLLVLQNEIPEAVNLDVALKAKTAGAKVIWNAAPARALSRELFDLVDVVIVNRVEAEQISGITISDSPDAADVAKVLSGTKRTAIVTLGADGGYVSEAGGEAAYFPAHKVEVISSHGAGDCFVGALAARLADGDPITPAVHYAAAAAALHVSTPIKSRGFITPEHVRKLISG